MSKYTDDRLQDRLGANKMAYEMEVEYNDTKLRRRTMNKDKTDWIEEELADGDKICAALGLERTEGGRLPIPKILSAIRERQHGITMGCWCRPIQDKQVPNLWIHNK